MPRAFGAGVRHVLKHGFAHALRHARHKTGHLLVAAPTRAVAVRVCVAIGFGFAGGAGPIANGAGVPPTPPSAAAPSAGLPDIPVSFDPGWSGAPVDPLLTVDPGDPRSLPDDPPAPAAVGEPPGIAAIALGLVAAAALRARQRRAASARA